jgi:hypothetical protein
MFENLRTFFDPTGKVAPTYEDLQQRKKIAVMMMARAGKIPTTFGGGLQAIGEALGDRYYYDKTLEDERGSRAYEAGKTGNIAEPEAPVVAPYSPGAAPGSQASVAPAVAVAPGPQAAVAPDAADPWTARSAGIAGIESGGAKDPYSLVGAQTRTGDRAIGKYQIMGANVPQWTAAALGQPMTPEQFRASPEAQEATFRHRFGQYVDKYGEEGAARAWYAGEGGMKNPNATDVHGRLTVAGYGGDYLKRLAAAGGNPNAAVAQAGGSRDTAAAILADRQQPLGGADVAQNALLAEVTGISPQAERAAYAPTASLRTGNVMSDADPESPVMQSVVDTVQARRGGTVAPQAMQPPPPGPQVAQANVFPPVVSAGGQVAPIIPGGGLPPAPAPAIAKAPEPPSAQIRSAPEAPQVKPMAPPTAPRLQPMVDDYIRQQATIANDPRLSDTTRAMALKQIEKRQGQIKAVNDQTLTEYNDYRKRYEDQQTPATVYGNEKLRRELEGEGAVPLTADQRKQFAIPESQPAWLTRRGEIKLGPVGTKVEVNTGDKAQSKGDEKLQEKLSESFIKTFEEGQAAGDQIKQLAEMRALAARVGTGAGAVAKQYLGQWGIKTEGLSEIQALQAGVSRLIPQQRVPGSGTSSDFDGEHFKNSIFALNKTPEGNNLIFDTMEGLAKNKLDRADVSGRVISGEITRAEGVKEMLTLQRQAVDLSERVKEHLKATGQDKSVAPAVPKVVSDDQMREFVKNNPNHPKAGEIRRQLGM